MNLLEPVDARDFAEIKRENNGKEVIAALNIIKAAHREGLNLGALVRNLTALGTGNGAPFGIYPFKD
jgi:hypothetical protein